MGTHTWAAYNHHYIRGITHLASKFNWSVIALTLGSYGHCLGAPLFWLCWGILVTQAVISYSIRPYFTCVRKAGNGSYSESSRRYSDGCQAGAVFLKVCMSVYLICILLNNHDFLPRQNKIFLFAGVSIIIFEGFLNSVIVREELNGLMPRTTDKGTSSNSEGPDWSAVIFLAPSVLSVVMCVTGAIVLAGELGRVLSDKVYWIFTCILVADVVAEAIHRFDFGNRSLSDSIPDPETLPKRHYIANVLRVVVVGFLCLWLNKEISDKFHLPTHLGVVGREWQSQERSRSLLNTMVTLGGFQAAGALAIPLCTSFRWPLVERGSMEYPTSPVKVVY